MKKNDIEEFDEQFKEIYLKIIESSRLILKKNGKDEETIHAVTDLLSEIIISVCVSAIEPITKLNEIKSNKINSNKN